MGIQLSHSAKNKYMNCPLSYYMHYILKYREEKTTSPLIFGSTIEEGLDALLLGKTLEEAQRLFKDAWSNPMVNGVQVDGRTTDMIKFSKSDSKEGLAATPWESMLIKGNMLLEAYQTEVLPGIKNIISLQEKVKIDHSNGEDSIIGYADLIVELQDGRIALMDNKTSAKAYPSDAVVAGDKAKQLALYNEALKDKYDIDVVGFYVLEKGIRKKNPRTRIQTLMGNVPEALVEETFDEIENVLYGIRMGQFESNHPNCNQFYGKCVCNKYAPSGGVDTSGLICTKKDKK